MDFDKQPMIDIYLANKEHVTSAAVLQDGEVISGRMPPHDYKLCDISADGWLQARNRMHELPKAAKSPNKDKRK